MSDPHREEFKWYRAENFWHQLGDFLPNDITTVCSHSSKLIQKLKLSTDLDKFNSNASVVWTRENLLEGKSYFMTSIDRVIEWLIGSDFDIVQVGWSKEIPGLDQLLKTIQAMSDFTVDSTKHNDQPRNNLPSQTLIHLATLVIPIIKLCRFFFNKLSVKAMNRNRLPMYTKMCSDDLRTIALLAGWYLMTSLRITGFLQDDFLTLVDTYTKDFPIQNYYKAWFATWQAMFTMAGDNLLNAAQLASKLTNTTQ
ncbi:hypothetical protein MJO28_000097 [Puccinia striiformis f. sp. tritici]|uniref:Uncharacterized protein n=1 Tax=Puccinia striiformis f. sp. tritici TaxID=168172 RepID=A0ACC0F001_9BASI|nr:hypothetical protein MJO28_000097 [Puccinia striiformis f. sp. tritici]